MICAAWGSTFIIPQCGSRCEIGSQFMAFVACTHLVRFAVCYVHAATPGALLAGRRSAGEVNFPGLALPQHRLYLLPEPQGHGALRAMGCEEDAPALTLGLWVVGAAGDAPALTLGLCACMA